MINGLIQLDKPESLLQLKGNATKTAPASENNRMFSLLTKINLLGK